MIFNTLIPTIVPIHRNQFSGGQNFPDYPISVPASGAYALTADYGAYTLTGQAADLLKASLLTGDYGLYNLSGQAADLIYAPVGSYTLNAENGLYNLAGQDALVLSGHSFLAEYGLYNLTGQDANLVYAPSGAYTLTADYATYLITGQAVNLLYSGIVDNLRGGGYIPPTLEQIKALREKRLTKKQKVKTLKKRLVEEVVYNGELPKPEVISRLVESLAKTEEEVDLLPQIEKIMALTSMIPEAGPAPQLRVEEPRISHQQAVTIERVLRFLEFVDEDVFTLLKII